MLIFGAIGFDQVPKIPVGIVSENPSPATSAFIEQLKSVSTFEITVAQEGKRAGSAGEGKSRDRCFPTERFNSRIPFRGVGLSGNQSPHECESGCNKHKRQ